MSSPSLTDDQRVAALRAALPAVGAEGGFAAPIYLNTGTAGPLPAETASAMAVAAERESTGGRAAPSRFEETLQRMDEARAAVAAVLHADLGSIALTHSTTEGLNLAAWGIDWRPGDVVVTSSLEHVAVLGTLARLRERFGVEVRIAEIGLGGDEAAILGAFERAVDARTRLVVVSHVTWSTGAVLPVGAIAALARAAGAPDVVVLVDGAQAAGAIEVDPGALGADAYAIPAQKWLLGPEGMGALWVRPEALPRIRPSSAGFLSFARHDGRGGVVDQPDARRYETAGYHEPSVVGFARSCGWLAMFVGLEWVIERAGRTAALAADRYAAIPGVELLTPRDRMGTLVVLRVRGWSGPQVVEALERRTFAVVRAIPGLDALRLSVAAFTTGDEIERIGRALDAIAALTPETDPRRGLAMLDEGPR